MPVTANEIVSTPAPPTYCCPAAIAVPSFTSPVEPLVITAVAAKACPVVVRSPSPEIVTAVASVKLNELIADAPAVVILTVVNFSAAEAAVSATAPVVVKSSTDKASVRAVGATVRPPRLILSEVPVPERLTDESALELILAAPKLSRLTVAIVPAFVALAALTSVMVTAPLAAPTTLAAAVAAAR